MDNLNDMYYHYTNYNSMNKIVNEGLEPKIGIRSKTKYDNRGGVFLSQGIYNSIKMYASMLRFYNTYNKDNGQKEIDKTQKEINGLEFFKNRLEGELRNQVENDIKKKRQDIEMIKYIMSFRSFIDYLGGEGYLLCVNNLGNVVSTIPEDCCYNNTIPTNIISTVVLRNEENGNIIDSRELLMNYFLRTIPRYVIETIIQNKETVDDLYNFLNGYNYVDYTGYELQEILLDFYNYKVKKIRPVIFN